MLLDFELDAHHLLHKPVRHLHRADQNEHVENQLADVAPHHRSRSCIRIDSRRAGRKHGEDDAGQNNDRSLQAYSELVARINSAPIKKSQSFRLDDLINTKERELAKVTRYKQSLYQDWKDGEITQQEYRTMKADYEQQSQRLSDILVRLTAERAELANGVDQEHPALVAFMRFENIDSLSREILIELIDHIKVYENGNISVRFKFADELRKIAEYIEINTTTDPAVAG